MELLPVERLFICVSFIVHRHLYLCICVCVCCPQICITTHPDTVLPIRVECKNVATVNIIPKMAASSVISVKVC